MHLILAVYASPRKCLIFEDWVNNHVTYRVKGAVREGWHRPFLSKLPFGLYDVRIQSAFAAQFLRDCGAADLGVKRSDSVGRVFRTLRVLLFLLHCFTPLKAVKQFKGTVVNKRPEGWMNILCLGGLADDTIKGGEYL